jgi:hypothetical protein
MVDSKFRNQYLALGESRDAYFHTYGTELLGRYKGSSKVGRNLAITTMFLGIGMEPKPFSKIQAQFKISQMSIARIVARTLNALESVKKAEEFKAKKP